MNPAITYDKMRANLGFWFNDLEAKVFLVGLLFCPPTTKLAKEEILPAIFDFHYSSDSNTQFYFPGYDQKQSSTSDSIGPRQSHSPDFEYNSKAFYDFVNIVKSKSKWKYSGGTDLLLVNGRYNSSRNEGYLDFSTTISLTLEFLKDKGSYPEIRMFFEKIFDFSKEYQGNNPVFAFSDEFGKSALLKTGKEITYRLLPSGAKKKVQEGLLFACSDLRKNKNT